MDRTLPPVLALHVTLRATEPQRLPPFLGSAVHGALARALYRTVCAFPSRAACPGCPLYGRCAYPALFLTPAPAVSVLRAAGIRDQAPRPLIVGPEPGWTRASGNPFRLAASAEVPLRITLVGSATDDVAVIVLALQAMARRGLGIPVGADERTRRRAGLELQRITIAGGTQVVYDPASDVGVPPQPTVLRPVRCPPEVLIQFVTPVRLKHNGRFASGITPPLFCEALARRADALAILFGAGEAIVDSQAVAAAAAQVEVAESRMRRVHVTRYSATQRRRMQWPGLMGQLRLRGAGSLQVLWPLLRFGELVQVGKGTALGFGRYQLPETARGVTRD